MKCQLFKLLRVFIVTVILCSFSQRAVSADFTLIPKINVRVEYNDNLFLTDSDKVADTLAIIYPSLSLAIKKKHLQTDLNYGLEFRKYVEESYLDRDKIEDVHRGDINGIVLPDSSFSILYEGSIERISTDDRRPDVEENDIVNVSTLYRGLLRPRYHYRLSPKVTGEIAYQYETSQYDDDDNRDIIDNEGDDIVDQDAALIVDMKYSERLDFKIDTKYNWHESDDFDDYEMWYGLAGFVWRLKEHLSLDVKAGGAITDLDNDDDDLTDSLYHVRLEYAPLEKTGYFISYIKDFTTSADDGRYRWWEASGGISYHGRLSGEVRGFTRENTYQFVDRKDEAYGGELDLTYDLTSNLSAGLLAGYSYRTYTPVKENTHRYTFNGSLSYAMKRSEITLRYVANINDSDLALNDYKNNIASIGFGMRF